MTEFDSRTKTIAVAEAKRRFSELIERVQAGERFVVSRRGKPVVALVSPELAATGDDRAAPVGVAPFVGALADWEDLEDVVAEIYRARRKARSRPAPSFD